VCYRAKFHQNRPSCNSNLSFFQDGDRLPFWICGANFGTTHNEHLVVQNLIGIACIVLIIHV